VRSYAAVGASPAGLDGLRQPRQIARRREAVEHDGELVTVRKRARRREAVEIHGLSAGEHAPVAVADEPLAHFEKVLGVPHGKRIREHGALAAELRGELSRGCPSIEPDGLEIVLGAHRARLA
jgi:hypothetical protein